MSRRGFLVYLVAKRISANQKGQVTGETWGGCKNGADVVLYTVEGGGHSWPGSDLMPRGITTQDIDATDTIWDFFAAHPK